MTRLQRPIRVLLLLYSLFIVYGTFIPFRFSADPEFVHSQWAHFFHLPFARGIKQFSVSDVISNVFLFVPFGCLWVAEELREPLFRGLLGATLGVTCLGFSFGLAIEIGQTFAPGRTASLLDALCDGIGAGVGATLGYFLITQLRGTLGSVLRRVIRDKPSIMLLAVMVVALLANAYYPFEITLDVSTVWQNVKQIPCQPLLEGLHRPWTDLFREQCLFFVALSCILANHCRRFDHYPGKAVAAISCILLAACVEAGKMFFAGRVPNPENVIIGAVGALLGSFVVAPLSRTRFVRDHSTSISIVLALGLEVYSELSPFDWIGSSEELRSRLTIIEWLPFAAYYTAAPQSAIFDFGKKLFIVAPLGFIIASGNRCGRLLAALGGLFSGAVLEACQIALRSRTPSITDVLVFGLGAWGGAVVYDRFWQIRISEKSSDRDLTVGAT